jgi:UDP-N-acetylmuramate dehydrogenase
LKKLSYNTEVHLQLAPGTNEKGFEDSIREYISLAPLTTLRIGGPARFFAEAHSGEEMLAGIRWASNRSLPVFVLGGGSNIVVCDQGFPGLVIRNAISGIQISPETLSSTLLTAGGGDQWDDVVKIAVAANLAGIECLSGIPGSVGATPIQNVGAYGQEVSETIVRLAALDTQTGAMLTIDSSECGFGYRTSRFKTNDSGRFVITSVTYRLHSDREPRVEYAELRRYLDARGTRRPTVAEVRDAVLAIRKAKSMVIDAADPDSRSVGSFFVNPVVATDALAEIERALDEGTRGPAKVPSFTTPGGMVKLSAAWLIEHAGFAKGYRYGGVGLSSRHSLAIVAREGGTAREVIELAGKIQEEVANRFGIRLVREPILVGFA